MWPFHLWFPSLAMVTARMHWSFGDLLAWRLSVCLLQQALLRLALPGSGERWARTAARLRLALVLVVFVRWFKGPILILIILKTFCTTIDGN
jgi:hypothetical protein